jgi:hypothetical protein
VKKPVQAKKPAAQVKKPALVPPVVLPASSRAANLSVVDNPAGGDSGWNLSDRGVLLLTFLLAIAAGGAVFLVRACWRRLRLVSLARRLKASGWIQEPEHFEDMQTVLQPWLLGPDPEPSANGTNGSYGTNGEPIPGSEREWVASGDRPTGT